MAAFEPWLLLLTAILLDTLGAVLFKHGVNQLPEAGPGWRGHLQIMRAALTRREIVFGLLVYVFEGVAWLATLSSLALSVAFSVFSANNILILLSSAIFLKERVGRRRWLGVGLIMIGIILVGDSNVYTF
ncbi:undecaprenyl phosphate-alpha-L-ara4N flippase subunit ArnE [Gammaproteobacteria bacterium]